MEPLQRALGRSKLLLPFRNVIRAAPGTEGAPRVEGNCCLSPKRTPCRGHWAAASLPHFLLSKWGSAHQVDDRHIVHEKTQGQSPGSPGDQAASLPHQHGTAVARGRLSVQSWRVARPGSRWGRGGWFPSLALTGLSLRPPSWRSRRPGTAPTGQARCCLVSAAVVYPARRLWLPSAPGQNRA